MKLSGSLWRAIIVDAKAVDHSYLDGFSRRCLLKLDKKGPTLSQKRLLQNFKRQEFERSFFLIV